MKRAAVIIVWTFAAEAAGAETWLVLPDGLGDAPTIQAGVDSAATGDEVVLGNGTFVLWESIDYEGKAITIRSLSADPTQCIIECRYNAGVIFRTGEGPSSVLEGVQFQGGWGGSGADEWGTVVCNGTSPTVRNIIVSESTFGLLAIGGGSPRFENVHVASSWGSAVHSNGSTPTITGSVLVSYGGPGTSGGAAAVYLEDSDATVENCRIDGTEYGGIHLSSSDATISNCRMEGNRGTAISMFQSSPLIRASVIAGNSVNTGIRVNASFPTFERCTITRNYSGGLGIEGGSTVDLQRTIVWGNCVGGGGGGDIYIEVGSVVNATCSDIRRSGVVGGGTLNAGPDVIDVPPMFCDPNDCASVPALNGDYTVDDDSPVITAPCGWMGALAANCTIHVERTSWGAIKALYR